MVQRAFLFGFFAATVWITGPAPVRADASAAQRILEEIPVQHGGRIKPFLGFAAESLLAVTGSVPAQGSSPARTVFGWMADPEHAMTQPLISVSFRPLKKYFPALVKHRASPEAILSYPPFQNLVKEAIQKQSSKTPLLLLEKEALSLYDKAYRFRQIAQGETPGWVPNPADLRGGWSTLAWLKDGAGAHAAGTSYASSALGQVPAAFEAVAAAFRKDPGALETAEKAATFSGLLTSLASSHGLEFRRAALRSELIYLRLHPFGWAWRFYLASFVLLLILGAKPFGEIKKISSSIRLTTGLVPLAAGFFLHTYGFYLRCLIAGRPPVSNMYESIIWVSWAIALVALGLYAAYKSVMLPLTASLAAAASLLVAEAFPAMLDPTISPLVPVLRSTLWLTAHVLTITFSYGAFALAWALGHVVTVRYVIWPSRHQANEAMTQYLYRALQVGVILLAVGTVLGGVWANYSWGRFWGWDPKETWALIALLGYIAVLHARYAGWLGRFGLAAWSVAAFSLVVMAWYGVNYVLAAGLHSYGFGGGGAPYVVGIFLADFIFMGLLAMLYRKRKSRSTSLF